jgi:hypothetical protein
MDELTGIAGILPVPKQFISCSNIISRRHIYRVLPFILVAIILIYPERPRIEHFRVPYFRAGYLPLIQEHTLSEYDSQRKLQQYLQL